MNKHLLAKITLLGAAQLFTFHTAFADILMCAEKTGGFNLVN